MTGKCTIDRYSIKCSLLYQCEQMKFPIDIFVFYLTEKIVRNNLEMRKKRKNCLKMQAQTANKCLMRNKSKVKNGAIAHL